MLVTSTALPAVKTSASRAGLLADPQLSLLEGNIVVVQLATVLRTVRAVAVALPQLALMLQLLLCFQHSAFVALRKASSLGSHVRRHSTRPSG
jgi:hypothetical protein